jgi:hypothetical protein
VESWWWRIYCCYLQQSLFVRRFQLGPCLLLLGVTCRRFVSGLPTVGTRLGLTLSSRSWPLLGFWGGSIGSITAEYYIASCQTENSVYSGPKSFMLLFQQIFRLPQSCVPVPLSMHSDPCTFIVPFSHRRW